MSRELDSMYRWISSLTRRVEALEVAYVTSEPSPVDLLSVAAVLVKPTQQTPVAPASPQAR